MIPFGDSSVITPRLENDWQNNNWIDWKIIGLEHQRLDNGWCSDMADHNINDTEDDCYVCGKMFIQMHCGRVHKSMVLTINIFSTLQWRNIPHLHPAIIFDQTFIVLIKWISNEPLHTCGFTSLMSRVNIVIDHMISGIKCDKGRNLSQSSALQIN